MFDEERAGVAFATMLNNVDADAFVPLLAPNVVWESQKVLTPIQGKGDVEAHISRKTAALLAARPDFTVRAELGRCGRQDGSVRVWSATEGRPCVLIYQGADLETRRPSGLVLLETIDRLVTRVDLCTIVPPPSSAERLATFPGLKRGSWPSDPLPALPELPPFKFSWDLALEDFLSAENVLADVAASDADQVHWFIARTLAASQPVEWFQIYDGLAVRHRILSTALEGGFGMPHEKVPGLTGLAACFARTREPVRFGGTEGTKLFFAVIAPTDSRLLRATALVGRLMKDSGLCDALIRAHSGREMYELLIAESRKYLSFKSLRPRSLN